MAKIKLSSYEPDYDVVPQAIFWRALKYFTVLIRNGENGLDEFQAASFVIGNNIRFDLRTYAGHPEFTVTLYLPHDISEQEEISRVIEIVIKEMVIPKNAIAWRRGEQFTYGDLKRPRGDRLREPEARILALKIAAQQPNRTASTQLIKKKCQNIRSFQRSTGVNRLVVATRPCGSRSLATLFHIRKCQRGRSRKVMQRGPRTVFRSPIGE